MSHQNWDNRVGVFPWYWDQVDNQVAIWDDSIALDGILQWFCAHLNFDLKLLYTNILNTIPSDNATE